MKSQDQDNTMWYMIYDAMCMIRDDTIWYTYTYIETTLKFHQAQVETKNGECRVDVDTNDVDYNNETSMSTSHTMLIRK